MLLQTASCRRQVITQFIYIREREGAINLMGRLLHSAAAGACRHARYDDDDRRTRDARHLMISFRRRSAHAAPLSMRVAAGAGRRAHDDCLRWRSARAALIRRGWLRISLLSFH